MRRGDVIVVSFPLAGLGTTKDRPALIVQADYYNQRLANVILVAITSNTSRAADQAHYLIDVTTPDGKLSGLHRNSVVSCINLSVVPKSQVLKVIGHLSDDAMQQIDGCLKASLGL